MFTVLLTASVRQNGSLNPADEMTVQRGLAALGFSWLAARRNVGPKAMRAIRLFAAIKNGEQKLNVSHNESRVNIGDDTHKWLKASNIRNWQRLVGSAVDGYLNVDVTNPSDEHNLGTDWFATTIVGTGTTYRSGQLLTHPAVTVITVNDARFPEGGNTPIHSGHELVCPAISGFRGPMGRLPEIRPTKPPRTTDIRVGRRNGPSECSRISALPTSTPQFSLPRHSVPHNRAQRLHPHPN